MSNNTGYVSVSAEEVDVYFPQENIGKGGGVNITVLVYLYERPATILDVPGHSQQVLNRMRFAVINKIKEVDFGENMEVDCDWIFLNQKPSR